MGGEKRKSEKARYETIFLNCILGSSALQPFSLLLFFRVLFLVGERIVSLDQAVIPLDLTQIQ